MIQRFCFLFLCGLLLCSAATAQEDPPAEETATLDLFLDCNRCDEQYIRTEIPFVNYVRDRTEADIHLLVTTERAGGGLVYTLNYIGLRDFSSIEDTLSYTSSNTDTRDERRAGLVRIIKMGLVRYVARTDQVNRLDVSFDMPQESTRAAEVVDKWNYWVFNVRVNGFMGGEESRRFLNAGGSIRADRVTEDLKIRLSMNGGYNENRFEFPDTTITSTRENGSFFGLVAKSLTPHWSAGGFVFANTSSFDNTKFSLSVSPALEYNIYPYAESTRREFRISYLFGLRHFTYEEETIFRKTSESFLRHELEIAYETRQPWGRAEFSVEANHFLHDFKEWRADLYRIELDGDLNLRLIRGLSLNLSASYSRINDQFFLPLSAASEEDILLGTVRLPSGYEYNFSIGFNYTFGSIYNNIVNSRFGF